MTDREYLFSLEQFGIKLGLEQIRALLAGLDRPDCAYVSIIVGGTNGKGSVTAMVERGLRAAGYVTGRYTSPHLVNIEERIAAGGIPIAAELFDEIAATVRHVAARLPAPPTFFEATTAMAAEAFRQTGVEVAVFEVGLGGRLDATNVLSPVGVGITAVDFDHEEQLGHTIEAIATEKAGIIKPNRFCVLGRNPVEVKRVVADVCRRNDAKFVSAPDGVRADARHEAGRTRLRVTTPEHDYGELTLGLAGQHQVDNAVTAVRILEELGPAGLVRISAGSIRTALEQVDWPARLELRGFEGREVLIDGAHNPAGAAALAEHLASTYGRPLPIVFGVMRDKNVREMVARLMPVASALICTTVRSPRACSAQEIASVARDTSPSLRVIECAAPMDAVRAAIGIDSPAVVAGSLFLAGEIRGQLP